MSKLENKKNIKAIFLDFDWTLFDHKVRDFNRKSLNALNTVKNEHNIKLIVNSARSFHSLNGLNTFTHLECDYCVSNNGLTCLDMSNKHDIKVIYTTPYPSKISKEILDLLNSYKLTHNIVTTFGVYAHCYDSKLFNEFYKIFYEPKCLSFEEYERLDKTKTENFPIVFELFYNETEEYKEFDKDIKELIKKYNLNYNRFDKNCVELTMKAGTKDMGINALINYLNISKNNCLAFGDDLNDIEMFDSVKYSVCLGNGKDEAKKHATYVTDTIENDGVYKALIHFNLID